MTIACYVRESKHDGQRAEIQRWLDGKHIQQCQVAWYADKENGATIERSAFDRLQKDILSGKVKTVVLWKLDRLSRRLMDGINIIASWGESGAKIVVVTQQIEIYGAASRMVAALLRGLAEIEAEYRHEQQKAGIDAARQKGVYVGRKRGTTKRPTERARELYDKGQTAAEIAQILGVSQRTVFRYLDLSTTPSSSPGGPRPPN